MSKLFVNIDTNDYGTKFLNILTKENTKITESDLYPFVDQYAGKGVTDLLICLNCQYSIPESRVLSDTIFKYEQKIENGRNVDYEERFHGMYAMYKQYEIDPIEVWLKRCREVGINPWVSFRMNDAHCPADETCFLRPELFYEAREKGWMIGHQYGYFKNCLNFAISEIRQKWLEFLDEQISKYDMDGVELDFQREIYCFDYINNSNCYKIMNGFMRDVRAIIRKCEMQKGHKISLIVRLSRNIEQNKVFGFDVMTWEKENLVDGIVVTPRWVHNDSDMPIKDWKKQFQNTEIYAGIETLIRSDNGVLYDATPDVVRGYCNRYLSDGADGMYLFNYYTLPNDFSEREAGNFKRCMEVFDTCGRISDIQSNALRYIVTGQDPDNVPKGCKGYRPLPIVLDSTVKELSLSVGKLLSSHKVKLFIGYRDADLKNVKVKVNDDNINQWLEESPKTAHVRVFSSEMPESYGYEPPKVKTYSCYIATETDGQYHLQFLGDKGEIAYIEFEIVSL